MSESYELPQPDQVAALDDLELVDAAHAATLMEIVAIDLRLAAMEEISRRQLLVATKTQPALPGSPRRRRRRNRKRKRRR